MVGGPETGTPEPADGGLSGLQNPPGGEARRRYRDSIVRGLELLAASKCNLGSLNVRGGLKLLGCSEKLQGIIARAKSLCIGVLALQETKIAGVKRHLVQDFDDEPWGFCSAGEDLSNELGTGFLVSPTMEIVSFKAFSPRVSMVEVRVRGKPCLETQNRSDGSAVVISAYAPTEQGGRMTADERASELQAFYASLRTALADGRARCFGELPLVCGDFNVSLVRDTRESQRGRWGKVIGKAWSTTR